MSDEAMQKLRNDLMLRLVDECTPAEAADLVASLCVGVVFCSTDDKSKCAHNLDQLFKAAQQNLKELLVEST